MVHQLEEDMNKADLEFYESALVLAVAKKLLALNRPELQWDAIHHPSKKHYLDKAVGILLELINNPACNEKLKKVLLVETAE